MGRYVKIRLKFETAFIKNNSKEDIYVGQLRKENRRRGGGKNTHWRKFIAKVEKKKGNKKIENTHM